MVAADKVLQHKAGYLNAEFFLVRAALYFLIWIGLAYLFNKWSLEQDTGDSERFALKLELLSGPGLVLYGATVTFSSIDWVMSLDPHWYSTIWGILFIGGQGVAALSFVIAVIVLLATRPPLSEVITGKHLRDLGTLLFAFIMLWAYFSFSQFLLIWAGNLPHEIPFYVTRMNGTWMWIGLFLVVFHFALPFLLLLSRDLKKNPRRIRVIALWVFCLRLVDLFWLAGPAFDHGAFSSALARPRRAHRTGRHMGRLLFPATEAASAPATARSVSGRGFGTWTRLNHKAPATRYPTSMSAQSANLG